MIESELLSTGRPGIEALLKYLADNGYYSCESSSHNHWAGGTAEHVWAVYLIAKELRNQSLDDPDVAKHVTDAKLAVVCLLHDTCDMAVKVYTNRGNDVSGEHGYKSMWIMINHGVGTNAERVAVRNHMRSDRSCDFSWLHSAEELAEHRVLHDLVHRADHIASGVAWNAQRYLDRRTQHLGRLTEDVGYLKAVAMDRTREALDEKMYVDADGNLYTLKNYNRRAIEWNAGREFISNLEAHYCDRLFTDDELDVLTAAHASILAGGEKPCIVVAVDKLAPEDVNRHLRKSHQDEREVLICSNLLVSMYESKVNGDNRHERKRFRFNFTMRDEIKAGYLALQQGNGILCKDVTMIREGHSAGFKFVKPYVVDVLMVPGGKFPMFAVKKLASTVL